MDASLRTQSDSYQFTMRDIELFADGSGGVCSLNVVSLPFSASARFYFDAPTLSEFVEQLSSIYDTLTGEAKLGQQFEEPYVAFRGSGRGHIIVSGLLIDSREHMQKLEFSFATDQTALAPFVSALREIARAA